MLSSFLIAPVVLSAVFFLASCSDSEVANNLTQAPLSESAFDTASQTLVRDAALASVELPANAFVTVNGQRATGTAEAAVKSIDLTQLDAQEDGIQSLIGKLPGDQNTDSTQFELSPYAMASFDFTQNGQPLQLGEGKQATIQLAIAGHQLLDDSILAEQFKVGDALPLWHYDTENNAWLQEGEATVIADPLSPTGFSAMGKVSHFSTWTMASAAPRSTAEIKIILTDVRDGRDVTSMIESFTAKASIDNSTGAWGFVPAGSAWFTSRTLTPRNNKINIIANSAERSALITSVPEINDWTRMKLEVTEITLDGMSFPGRFSRLVAFSENAPNLIELEAILLNDEPIPLGYTPVAVDDLIDAEGGLPLAFDLCANDTIGAESPVTVTTAGLLPNGLTASGCVLSGIPLTEGTFSFTYTLANANTGESDSAVVNTTIQVIDTDSDGVPDFIDDDDDNDGILDTVECEVYFSSVELGGADGTFESLRSVATNNQYNSNVTGGGWRNSNGSADSFITPMPTTGSSTWSGIADGTPPSANGGVFAGGGTWYGGGEAFYTTISGLDTTKQYEIEFQQANSGVDGATPINGLTAWRVVFGRQTLYTPTMPYKGEGNQIWQDVTLTFQPASSSQRLEFFAHAAADGGSRDYMAIDGIRVLEPRNSSTNCDHDGDGITNDLDLDSDNDGINDVYESGGIDNNSDGQADDLDGDSTNNNGIPSTAGTGNTPTDSDLDGDPDPYDID